MFSVSLTIDSLDLPTPETAVEAFVAAIRDGVPLSFSVYASATAHGPVVQVTYPAEESEA